MTKEELAQCELKPISNIVPNWGSLPLWQQAVIEAAFNLEWWRGFYAPRAVTLDSRGFVTLKVDDIVSGADPIADSQRIWLAVQKEREWQQTPLGAAFRKFESATQRYWQQDSNEHISNKRLTELDEACRKARAEFLTMLRGW